MSALHPSATNRSGRSPGRRNSPAGSVHVGRVIGTERAQVQRAPAIATTSTSASCLVRPASFDRFWFVPAVRCRAARHIGGHLYVHAQGVAPPTMTVSRPEELVPPWYSRRSCAPARER